MLRIKKLDIFVLKSFLLLFAGTFFICLFIFMMQFLWRYVDELVGKGLEINVLAQFFFYSGLTLIPLSLPLAILLAALMTFGNFGERYELLSMKAAGIPLLRIMRPVVLFCVFLGGMSFFFQNVIGPRAQKQLWTLLVSMKQKSPEVDIPEGVFYSDIDGYNIYVKQKDRKTGMLKDILIYNFSDGFENAHIIWAAEGKLELTADKQHLFLHLYNGEQFENLKSQSVISRNVPYRRETFKEKHTLIKFSSEFNMVDGSFLDRRSDIKNMHEISVAIDSLTVHADSVGRSMYTDIMSTTYRSPVLTPADSTKMKEERVAFINTDSIYNSMTSQEKLKVLTTTGNRISSLASDWDMKSFLTKDTDNNIRSHRSDWHKKITLSLACIIFFFIGAPLGAIIRKGGLGMPVVISVLIFVIYYIIDSGATRVAKSGEMNIVLGTWMSTIVLAPLGAFFTYKSNKDSVVFNIDVYAAFFRKLFGIRQSRHLFKKEVIIHTPEYQKDMDILEEISRDCTVYLENHRLKGMPNYIQIFTNNKHDDAIAEINKKMETVIEELSNTKDAVLLNLLNNYPFLSVKAHKSLFDNRWLNLLFGIVIPAGLLLYLNIWRYRIRLDKDLRTIIKNNQSIIEQIRNQQLYLQ
ncbi:MULTISPECIES: LptF/LptG family permease [unclassified Phocaeicola]|mgnify:FL=1|jgi:lipopolysaccharide export system permease protein|uniref:LptF/LptG family permease n=1 Tax=unclassified Phocaeicola TaxID=2762211 RepID=UPI00033653C9|nr:permease YjgP/YjgQ family [Bacteroides sp. CAG:1076]